MSFWFFKLSETPLIWPFLILIFKDYYWLHWIWKKRFPNSWEFNQQTMSFKQPAFVEGNSLYNSIYLHLSSLKFTYSRERNSPLYNCKFNWKILNFNMKKQLWTKNLRLQTLIFSRLMKMLWCLVISQPFT